MNTSDQLQAIANELAIESPGAAHVVTMISMHEEPLVYLKDLKDGGFNSGSFTEVVTYHDCYQFLSKYYHEVERFRKDQFIEVGFDEDLASCLVGAYLDHIFTSTWSKM